MSALWQAAKDRLGLTRGRVVDADSHLAAAAQWLARAQDATPDDGVAAWYDLKEASWKASYPETTGYIVPTLYDYAAYAGRPDYAERALRMAEWELEIQLAEGGVRAGTVDSDTVAPTIFNTGQVLFGWVRAYRETRDARFQAALVKAADWLLAAQDEDGAWRRFASPFAAHKLNTYNTRTAYGIAKAGVLRDDERYLKAARKNVAWAIARAQPNTWLDDNCLEHNERPLTHTIAYSLRGILEVGAILNEDRYIDFAVRMARALVSVQRGDGALPGRLDREWQPMARWSCLTGNSQMAINWFRLAQITGENSFREAAQRSNRFNMSVQSLDSRDLGVRGGIRGSFPVDGGYMTYRYPNWAAKFFMDAVLLGQGYEIDY